MSRVELVTGRDAPLLAQPFYADGDPGAIVAALAHVPELMDVTLPFVGRVLGATSIDARTKELVILRVSATAGCRYCVDTHTIAAVDLGMQGREVAALRGDIPVAAGFPMRRDQTVVAWADGIATGHYVEFEDLMGDLREWFRDFEVVELTLLAATTLLLNRFCTALALPTASQTCERLAEAGYA